MEANKINLHVAFIPFENKKGITAFFAEYPQISVQALNKEEALSKLAEAIEEFPEVFKEIDFELTEKEFELVA